MSLDSNVVALVAIEHPIKTVTIFQSSNAEVMREITVDLQNGRNVVEILGISDSLDPDSPRVHGLEENENVRLFEIFCNPTVSKAPRGRGSQNAEELRRLRARRAVMEAQCRLHKQEADILASAASITASNGATFLEDMKSLLRHQSMATNATLGLTEEIAELDREIWLLDRKYVGRSEVVISMTLFARRGCQMKFQLSYLVAGVSWSPSYSLYATIVDGNTSPNVKLHYGANVTQKTGEEWTNVELTLSTATSQALQGLSIPTLSPSTLAEVPSETFPEVPPPQSPLDKIDMHQVPRPPPLRAVRPHSRYDESSGPLMPQQHYAFHIPSAPESVADEPVPWSVDAPGNAATVLDENPLALAYHIQGPATLPSDGLAHRLAITTLSLETKLKYVCVPKMNKSVFIEASVKNTSEYELLAGPVTVFMDDGFVTKTTLELIAVNQKFECILGVDTALRVLRYTTDSRTVHETACSFAEPTKTTTRTARASILNGHTFDVQGLIVRDLIPHGDMDAKISVTLRKPEGLALAKDEEEVTLQTTSEGLDVKVRWTKVEDGKGGEKDGMFEWVCGVGAGKKVELEAEWEVKTHDALNWEEKTTSK